MQVLKVNLNKFSEVDISLIAEYLKRGKIIAYPTDTIYGLGCDARNAKAIKQINKIKGERGNKPLIILVGDLNMLRRYCFFNQEQEKYLKKAWLAPTKASGPGPVTVILKRKPLLPDELTGGLNSIAVRLPQPEFLIKIISLTGFPLVSTSLNQKGDKPLSQVKDLEKYFKYLPDLVVDAGELRGRPSRLIDLRDVNNVKILRK